MFVNPQQVVEEFAGHNTQQKAAVLMNLNLPTSTVTLTPEMVERAIAHIRDRYDEHRMTKGIRPWSIVDITRRLDPEQPWVGMEYETGWNNLIHYRAVVDWLWRHVHNNTMDHEGCGTYYAELTFAPCNLSDFNANASDMDRLLEFTHRNKIRAAQASGVVGIHVNYSTPLWRTLTGEQTVTAHRVMNAALQAIPMSQQRDLFGRQPYGYLYNQTFTRPNGQPMRWIEAKLFQSTDDTAQWGRYKYVINRLINLMDVTATWARETNSPQTINLYRKRDVLNTIGYFRAQARNPDWTMPHNAATLARHIGPQRLPTASINNLYLFLNGNTDAVDLEVLDDWRTDTAIARTHMELSDPDESLESIANRANS